jgi:acyl-CoA reductase-like NAD-dependent aldehyde dehydrogenase
MTKYATVDPTTGKVLAEYATMPDADVEQALARAAEAYRSWREADLAERATVLSRVADLHRQHDTELAKLMTLEMGKPIAQAKAEVELSATIYEYYATSGPRLLADEVLDIAGAGRALVRTAPIGPLLGIMPWNYPCYQVARFVAPNLLLGNTILLKHAANCPQQALRIADIIEAAGPPAGVYQNVFASSEQVAELIASPQLQGVSLTGSERAGSAVGELAGRYLKKCVLEVPGSDPFIVLADADLQQAVAAAAAGRFGNAGQACTSAKRLIIQTPVWEQFLEAFLAKAADWQVGDPTSEETRLGPMSSVAARRELAAQVEDAVAKGAVIHLGGTVPAGEGAFYPATVLSGVTPGMRAYQEELLGPVAVLYKVDSVDEAIELANDSRYGPGSAVFTGGEDEASYVADRLDVGVVSLNTTIKSAPDLPFGGVKNSGIGRELGRFGLDEFSNKKLVHISGAGHLPWHRVESGFRDRGEIRLEAPDHTGSVRWRTIEHAGSVVGRAIVAEPAKPGRATSKHATAAAIDVGGARTPQWPELPALVRAAAIGCERLLVTGEAGVGKRTVLREAFGSTGHPLRELDCAAAEEIGSEQWLAMARSALVNDGATPVGLVVISHLETLSVSLCRALGRILDQVPGESKTLTIAATWTATGLEPGPVARALLDRFASEPFEVPPLRKRPGDVLRRLVDQGPGIPALSRQATEQARLHPWPGNHRQLEEFLRWLGRQNRLIIEVGDLPPRWLREAARSRLTAIQAAEADAIAAALRANDGNKAAAASQLGIARSSLYRKMREYRLRSNRGRDSGPARVAARR